MTAPLRYALVHEWLTPHATGGSELVVREILQHVDADLFALIDFESRNPDSYLHNRAIGTTFLQRLPRARYGVQKYLPLLPIAIEQLDLSAYDILLSSSHAVAKGVLTRADQLHICYCHAPMRYAWDLTHQYLGTSRAGRGPVGIPVRYLLHRLRQWDVLSANRVDYFIANSHTTARRIWRCYRRRAEVIYPPVNVHRFPFQNDKQDYFVTVSRLVGYKRVPLIVEAFNRLGLPLVVIGGGKALGSLRKIAAPNVRLLGEQPDEVVSDYVANARAFVYAAHEDFGIASVEAQACGTPVIAFDRGGTGETTVDLRHDRDRGTGILYGEQSVDAIIDAVETFERLADRIEPARIRQHALTFSPEAFAQRYLQFIQWSWQDWHDRQSRDRDTPFP